MHEPIVSPQLFYRVQEILKKRSADTGEKGKFEFLLRGTAYCQVCGLKLTGEIHPRGSYYRCLPNPHIAKCTQPYTAVKKLDAQLEAIYERMQPPKKMLLLLKVEMEEITRRRNDVARKETNSLKKTIADYENRELKLLDEKVGGKLARDVYERLEKQYVEKKSTAEARLSQLEVDYNDPLDFLDKCIVVASMISYLHRRFNFHEKKNLLKAIFEKIYVQERAITGVKLNPPFSFLLKNNITDMFEERTSVRTKEDIFEQIIRFTLSEQYATIKDLIEPLAEKAKSFIHVAEAA